MPRGLLSAHLAAHPSAPLPVAFEEETCLRFDGRNCFCGVGERCLHLAKEGDHYVLGCDGRDSNGELVQLLDGHERGLKGARCVPDGSDSSNDVKDGHESIRIRLDGKDVDVVPRYPLPHVTGRALDGLMKLEAREITSPEVKILRRDAWVRHYKEEVHGIYAAAMQKLHRILEAVVSNEDKPDDVVNPDKRANASMAANLFSDAHDTVQSHCLLVSAIARRICSRADHCEVLDCGQGAKEEDLLGRYGQLVLESVRKPEKHGIRRGLMKAGVSEEVIDGAGGRELARLESTAGEGKAGAAGAAAGGAAAATERSAGTSDAAAVTLARGPSTQASPASLALLGPPPARPQPSRCGREEDRVLSASRCGLARSFL